MNSKHLVYTLGTIDAFQSKNLQSFKQVLTNSQTFQSESSQHCFQKISTIRSLPISTNEPSDIKSNSNMPIFLRKTKIIKKPVKGKESWEDQKNSEKQTVLFKYFKRRLFDNPKKFEINSQKDKNFHLLKVFDWQMEVCQNLYLSKDTFYTAVTMAKRFYSKQRNQYYCQKILEIQVAAMISIAAKVESNKVNYPEAISVVCNFNKSDIVDGQIFIMKALNFNVPRINILSDLVETCNTWNTYLKNSSFQAKLNINNIGFGDTKNIKQWDQKGKANFLDFTSIFDIFAINLQSKYDFGDQVRIRALILQSLFMFVNYKQRQLFPLSPSQKTIVSCVFEDFMRSMYQYKKQEFTSWLVDVIKQQKNRSFVQKIYQYFQSRAMSRKYQSTNKQDYFSDQSTQSNCSLFGQVDFCQQRYLKI